MLVLGLARSPGPSGTDAALLRQAARAAHGSPILAYPVDAEQLALRGDLIWIGNPLDAFARTEQRSYLGWLRGEPSGDGALAAVRVALVPRDSPAQQRLAADRVFRELGRDASAVLYERRG